MTPEDKTAAAAIGFALLLVMACLAAVGAVWFLLLAFIEMAS